MSVRPNHVGFLSLIAFMLAFARASSTMGHDPTLLIDRQLQSRSIELIELNDRVAVYGDIAGRQLSLPIDQCVALLLPEGPLKPREEAVLRLSDGQVFPGSLITDSPASDGVLLWRHARLGRIEVPLNVVASIQLKASPPPVSARDADLVELANGDRLEGFVTGISDSLLIEIEPEDDAGQVRSLAVPFANIASVTMVSPPRNREGTRVWLRDGTIFRVDSIRIGDDGFMRLAGPWITDAAEPWELSDLAAVVFDSSAIIPLASLSPTRIDGPDSRYVTPGPVVVGGCSPAGLCPIEITGPVAVRYSMSREATRFAAEAVLPRSAARFGDYELIIRSDDEVLFHQRLNVASPRARINVPVSGSELIIEITEGANGPIQDQLLLNHAMLLVK